MVRRRASYNPSSTCGGRAVCEDVRSESYSPSACAWALCLLLGVFKRSAMLTFLLAESPSAPVRSAISAPGLARVWGLAHHLSRGRRPTGDLGLGGASATREAEGTYTTEPLPFLLGLSLYSFLYPPHLLLCFSSALRSETCVLPAMPKRGWLHKTMGSGTLHDRDTNAARNLERRLKTRARGRARRK